MVEVVSKDRMEIVMVHLPFEGCVCPTTEPQPCSSYGGSSQNNDSLYVYVDMHMHV